MGGWGSIWDEFSAKMLNKGAARAAYDATYACLASKGRGMMTGKGVVTKTLQWGSRTASNVVGGAFGGTGLSSSAAGMWGRRSVLSSMAINAGLGGAYGAASSYPGDRGRGFVRGAFGGAALGLGARGAMYGAKMYGERAPVFGSYLNKGLRGARIGRSSMYRASRGRF